MATPNYGYEKRQKELAKKRKKEEKLKAKAERKPHDASEVPADEPPSVASAQAPGEGTPGTPLGT